MPIFDQGYQHWSGTLSGHSWRWLTITRHGVRVVAGDLGGIDGGDLFADEIGGATPPGAEDEGDVVTLDAGLGCEYGRGLRRGTEGGVHTANTSPAVRPLPALAVPTLCVRGNPFSGSGLPCVCRRTTLGLRRALRHRTGGTDRCHAEPR